MFRRWRYLYRSLASSLLLALFAVPTAIQVSFACIRNDKRQLEGQLV